MLCDGDHPLRPAWATYFSFALVELRVQNDVLLETFFFSNSERRSDFNRRCADQHGLSVLVQLLNLIGNCEIFFFSVRKTTSGFSRRSIGLFVE